MLPQQMPPVVRDLSPPPYSARPAKPKQSKRGKITIVACINCRRRKTKCNGKRPVCSQCEARDGLCRYDMSEEQRRLTYLRENVECLTKEKSTLESLIWNLRVSSEDESIEILRQLRTNPYILSQDVQAEQARRNAKADKVPEISTLCKASSASEAGPRSNIYRRLVLAISECPAIDVSHIVRRLRLQEDVESIFAAITVGTLLQRTDGQENERLPIFASNAHPPLHLLAWTDVCKDSNFINLLLAQYFSWQHTFFQSLPEKLFQRDMFSGKTKYCSKLLVNALCASSSLLLPRHEARSNFGESTTVSTAFLDEATQLLKKTEISSIPSVASLFILSYVESYCGRLNIAWDYCGRSARMALDLSLHLRNDLSSLDEQSFEAGVEETARTHVFWGCFIADQLISFTLGRLPQIPTTAITVDLPNIVKELDDEPWIPHEDTLRARRPGACSTTFHKVACLSKIINSTLYLFFAPSQPLTGSLLLDEYQKYLAWYRLLPSIVASTQDAPPHILCLHMYYHAAVLLLIRPFLKAKFTFSDTSPIDICRQAAAYISELFAQYKRWHPVVGTYTFPLHFLLTACTIHIINLPAIASTTYLVAACNDFHDLSPWNSGMDGCLDMIKSLVQKWGIILPLEVESALYRIREEIAQGQAVRDHNMWQQDFSRSIKRGAPSLSSSSTLSLADMVHDIEGSSRVSSLPGLRSSRDHTNNLFAPIPSQPPPLLRPIQTSTSAKMEQTDKSIQMVGEIDGLTFEHKTWFDPFTW